MLAAWAPTLVALVTAIYFTGGFAERQKDHTKRLDGLDERLDDHAEHLSKVDLALVRLEEYNRGFADASRLAQGKT